MWRGVVHSRAPTHTTQSRTSATPSACRGVVHHGRSGRRDIAGGCLVAAGPDPDPLVLSSMLTEPPGRTDQRPRGGDRPETTPAVRVMYASCERTGAPVRLGARYAIVRAHSAAETRCARSRRNCSRGSLSRTCCAGPPHATTVYWSLQNSRYPRLRPAVLRGISVRAGDVDRRDVIDRWYTNHWCNNYR